MYVILNFRCVFPNDPDPDRGWYLHNHVRDDRRRGPVQPPVRRSQLIQVGGRSLSLYLTNSLSLSLSFFLSLSLFLSLYLSNIYLSIFLRDVHRRGSVQHKVCRSESIYLSLSPFLSLYQIIRIESIIQTRFGRLINKVPN